MYKKILRLRPLALQYVKYNIGLNSSFEFWRDPWFRGVPLIQRFNSSIVSIADSLIDIKAGAYMENFHWYLPSSNHVWVIELRNLLCNATICSRDTICWQNSNSEHVTTCLIWNSIRPPELPLPWVEAVWHPLHIPKCSFTLWLALRNRLLTKDRMAGFGMNSDLRCVLCNNNAESVPHLFSSCIFSRSVMSDPNLVLTCDWSSYLLGQFTLGLRSRIKKFMAYLFLSVAVYHIWHERNEIVHNSNYVKKSPAQIKDIVKRVMREKLSSHNAFQRAAASNSSLVVALF